MRKYRVEDIEQVELICEPPLSAMYVLSPYVWKEGGVFCIAIRAVNHAERAEDKVARIYFGRGSNGRVFEMDDKAAIAPEPGGDDKDGCEDPTVLWEDGILSVFYTGWNQDELAGRLLLARGTDRHSLKKLGRVLPEEPGFENTKEATVAKTADGWLMFFEYSRDGASLIGKAAAERLEEEWTIEKRDPWRSRENNFDCHHLSTGPIALHGTDRPVMFYNGSDKDTRWRIGWIEFDEGYRKIVRRCDEPLIEPPVVTGDATDIAFAASAVEHGDAIWLYYSISDKDMYRATIRI